MSHSIIVARLASFRLSMEKASLSRIYFNFFISSICTQPMLAEEHDLFF